MTPWPHHGGKAAPRSPWPRPPPHVAPPPGAPHLSPSSAAPSQRRASRPAAAPACASGRPWARGCPQSCGCRRRKAGGFVTALTPLRIRCKPSSQHRMRILWHPRHPLPDPVTHASSCKHKNPPASPHRCANAGGSTSSTTARAMNRASSSGASGTSSTWGFQGFSRWQGQARFSVCSSREFSCVPITSGRDSSNLLVQPHQGPNHMPNSLTNCLLARQTTSLPPNGHQPSHAPGRAATPPGPAHPWTPAQGG